CVTFAVEETDCYGNGVIAWIDEHDLRCPAAADCEVRKHRRGSRGRCTGRQVDHGNSRDPKLSAFVCKTAQRNDHNRCRRGQCQCSNEGGCSAEGLLVDEACGLAVRWKREDSLPARISI